jgi:hypothetical protein
VGFAAFQSAAAWGFSYARWAGIFAVAFLKSGMQQRTSLPSAGAVLLVLLCAAGLAGKAQAQEFASPTVTSVTPNAGPPSGGTSVTITGTDFTVGGAGGRLGTETGSLANGRHGGNGAPPGTRLIDMAVMPLPPGSGMPPIGETRFSPDQVVLQFGSGTTPQQIVEFAQRFGLTPLTQQTIGMLNRDVYTFRIANGQSVREVIRRIESAEVNAAVQPHYISRLAEDPSDPSADPGDPAQ